MATIDKTVARYQDDAGIRRRAVGKYTGPASYATGGDSLTAAELGMKTIETLHIENPINSAASMRLATYDHANAKVVWNVPSTDAEPAATTDLSGFSARFEAVGY